MSEARTGASAIAPSGPRPVLRRRDVVAIIVGIVVGAGIFKTPAMVAGAVGDSGWMLAAWLAGGGISLIGALCYAELATAFPQAGGDYHFLTRAYGRDASFIYAWARATVINSGSIALLAFVFGDYLAAALPAAGGASALLAAAVVVVLTLVNIAGLAASARTQNVLTALEVAGLLAIVAAGLALPAAGGTPAAFSHTPDAGMLGLALVFVLLTYGGWNEAAYVSAELKGRRRALLDVLIVSIAIIAALYLAVNAALLHGLGLGGLAESKAAAADVAQRAFGPLGGRLLAIAVAVSTLTSINATMMVGARSSYALGRDWPVLAFLSRWDGLRDAPVAAYLVQAAISLLLIGFGALQHNAFAAMVEFTAPVFWGFLFLVGVSLFVLRARHPDAPRPFRVPLYPATPLVFCLACGYLFYSSIAYAASRDAGHISLGVVAAGLAALALLRWFSSRPAPAQALAARRDGA